NIARGPKKFCESFVAQTGDFRRRIHADAEKNFIRVNVADASDQLLIHQDRFHGAATLPQDFFEFRNIEIERIWAECSLFQKLIHILDQSDLAQLALIIESEPVVFGENEQHPCVRRRLFLVFEVMKRASHAEMQSQPDVAISADKQMFAMAAARFEAAPLSIG